MSYVRSNQKSSDREVLEFDFGVRVYPPANNGGYWRIRWEERHRGRDTTAPRPGRRHLEGVGARRAARPLRAHRARPLAGR